MSDDVSIVIEAETAEVVVEETQFEVVVEVPEVTELVMLVPGPQGPPGQGLRRTVITIGIDDWSGPTAGMYTADLVHALEDLDAGILCAYDDDANPAIAFDRVETISENTLRLWVPAEPDGRWTGIITIIGGLIE